MKKFLITTVAVLLLLSTLFSCVPDVKPAKETSNRIPMNSINYVRFTLGNVIQDGKRAIFFEFISDYAVTKIELVGELLDKNGDAIYSFDTAMNYTNPSRNPEFAIRIDKNLVESVNSVRFAKIAAHTNETVSAITSEEKTPVLKHLATIDESTISNYYSYGSEIRINSDGEITLSLTNTTGNCGFRWDLSEVDFKTNTEYRVVFECMYVAAANNTSIRLKTTWHDSTYDFFRYYHVTGQRFDIIHNGRVEECYYKILAVKKYDEYAMAFSFAHNVDEAKTKTLYFDFQGVRHQVIIRKISLYEVTYE